MQTGWGELSDIHKVVGLLYPTGYTRTGAQRMVRLGLTISPASEKSRRPGMKGRQRPGLYGKGQAASGRN